MIGGRRLQELVRTAVTGYDPMLVGPVSLDVRLAGVGEVEDRDYWTPCRIVDLGADQRMRTKTVSLEHGFHLRPGQLLLVETVEHFQIPLSVAGMFTLRSVYARNGLDQVTSLVLRPGWTGRLLLELRNYSAAHTIVLNAEEPVGQIHFFHVDS